MGNCQAIDNATLVIQHPCGRVDRLYWPVTASEVMKMNPGHYVALLLKTTTTASADSNSNSVHITRIRLLRPTDTLILGQAYRLFGTQEVMKGLRAKKFAKMMKKQGADEQERMKEKQGCDFETLPPRRSEVLKHDRHRPRPTTSANSAAAKSKAWQPSLGSISEAGS